MGGEAADEDEEETSTLAELGALCFQFVTARDFDHMILGKIVMEVSQQVDSGKD
jgi:hypothetical protein